jgi:DNA-binding NarL/FixJ family response regulator
MNPSLLNTQLQSGLRKLRIIVEACPHTGSSTSGSSQIQTHAGYRFAPKAMGHADLTPRETEALKFIAEGLTNARIAIEMKISIKTVEKHRQCIMNKLGRHDTAALTRYAVGRGILFDEEFRRVLIERLHRQSSPWRTKMITIRETEVLRLVAGGLVNKQIASELNISIKTVGNHRQALMDRLNIHEVAGLTRYAISEGLIPNHAPAAQGSQTTRSFPTATV